MLARHRTGSFWTTIPGILTAIAGVITAIGGLIAVLNTSAPLIPRAPAQQSPSSAASVSAGSNVPPPPIQSTQVILSPDPFFLANRQLVLTESNIHGRLQIGKVYWQEEAWIGGERYEHPIGMHAPDNGIGYAVFSIPLGARFFTTVFGLARDDKNSNSYGDAIGRVYVDENLVWTSNTSGSKAIHAPAIPIPPSAKTIRLEVDSKGTNWADQTTWGNPRFTSAP